MPEKTSQPSESPEESTCPVQENRACASGDGSSSADSDSAVPRSKFKKILAAVNAFLESLDEEEEPEPPPPPEKPLKESVRELIERCRDREKRIVMLKEAGEWCWTMFFRGTVFFFLFVLTLYLTMLLDGAFVDETDVFYGGYSVVKGGDIYKAYPSQHMPFSYYFSAIIALFGAREENWFRVGFYVMLSGLWTGIYIRNRKHIPRLALIMLPVLYITQLKMYSLATRMLSDHWQGIGLVIILLELIRDGTIDLNKLYHVSKEDSDQAEKDAAAARTAGEEKKNEAIA